MHACAHFCYKVVNCRIFASICSLSEDNIGHTTKTWVKLPWNATREHRMECRFKLRMAIPRYANGILDGHIRYLRVKKKETREDQCFRAILTIWFANFLPLGARPSMAHCPLKMIEPIVPTFHLAASFTNWSWIQSTKRIDTPAIGKYLLQYNERNLFQCYVKLIGWSVNNPACKLKTFL